MSWPAPFKCRDDWEESIRFRGKMELDTPPTEEQILAHAVEGCDCCCCQSNRELAFRLNMQKNLES